ncbi:MAG: cell division protein FtsA [Bacteroidetes bacterium]|nr:cell division protein FtsA [Bacteroidota bacterium]
MENQDIIVGLDIGTTKIVAIAGRNNGNGKIEILGMGRSESVGVSRGVVTHITQTTDSIRQAVEQASKNAIRSAQQNGQLLRKELGDIEISQGDVDRLTDDMYGLVMRAGEEIIDVIPLEFNVDAETGIKNPVGMSGRRLEGNFHIIIGKVSSVNNIRKCVEKAGLSIASCVIESIASSEAVLNQDEKEGGVVLVDIGGGTTDIAIFLDNVIRHTNVIPLGGNQITNDIREGCSVIRKHAELMKVQYGHAFADDSMANDFISVPGIQGRPTKEISVKNLAHIIQARMEDIIELVHSEIRNTGWDKKLIAGIVITGGGAQLKNCSQLFEYITGMDTRVGYPGENLSKIPFEDISLPMYATSIGLVMKGIHHHEKMLRRGQAIQASRKRSGFFDNLFSKWFDEGIQ